MADTGTKEKNYTGDLSRSAELPTAIEDWNKEHVRDWILTLTDVDSKNAYILYEQEINGPSLLLLNLSDLQSTGIKLGPAKLITQKREELKAYQVNSSPGTSCKPYPFNQFHAAYRYKENCTLDVPETGNLNFIEPCHEYKAFVNCQNTEQKLIKFTKEFIRFAGACINSHTNGTIHFGVGDSVQSKFSHGQVLGVSIEDREAFVNELTKAIEGYFEHKHVEKAKLCIKTPRFVEVLKADMTFSGKYVIEVDIEPSSVVCEDKYFHTYNNPKKMSKGKKHNTDQKDSGKSFYIRENGSSRDLLSQKCLKEYNKHVANIEDLSQMRKDAEEKHLAVIKNSVQGSRLCEMITGGSQSLDKSHFEQYVLVTNKSHSVQLESLAFLLDMNFTAVLDFDPESAKTGLKKLFKIRNTNVHLPVQYNITETVEEIAKKLKLTRTTSWVFCNGGVNEERPSDLVNWLMEKGSSIRDVVSLLCRPDVLPPKKFLIIFLLLSDVTDNHDPLLETFNMFLQALKGTEQILCICENKMSYTYWNDLISTRYAVDISKRCIYELSFAEINGAVLSLWSENRKSSRFLPTSSVKVLLPKKVEGSLDTLSILCVNQCEGGSEDKRQLQENFYKGGKVSWWNLYFSEELGSVPFIKRDKFDYIINTIIPGMCSLRQACVRFNILHVPGCGGTTLAMHVLWTLKEKYRCAVLKSNAVDYTEVAQQVVKLLNFETTERQMRLPVLLMIDDFEDIDAVSDLQQNIEKECRKKNVSSKSPQVILLNCMRIDPGEQTEATDDTVFIGNKLSEMEQKSFEKKLEEIEKTYEYAETFYGFMTLKKNFSPKYIQGVVKNTLKGFNYEKNKHAQLIAVLVLLHCYCKHATLSVSICEEFLGLPTRPNSKSCKVEDGFEKLSTLVTRCRAESSVVFEAVRVIHSSIAKHCLEELTATFNISKAQITNLLLTTEVFYSCVQGKDKLKQDVRNILVRRQFSAESLPSSSQFSPLIQAITKETPGLEENVLLSAAKRFPNDAIISQLLSRYQYLEKKDFREAKEWSMKARDLNKDSSYMCDTYAQVIKHELKDAFNNDKHNPIKSENLKDYLKMAVFATEAFRETQDVARKEISLRPRKRKDFSPYNTGGRLGELQVAVTVLEILGKIPLFSSLESRDNLGKILSGKMKIQDMEAKDPNRKKNALYYSVLQEFTDFLYDIKDNMKKQFIFFDKYFVNLTPYHPKPDKREFRVLPDTYKCFREYANLFCKANPQELKNNNKFNTMYQTEKYTQYLEENKADSFSGLLEYLSNKDSSKNIEQIIERYKYILDHSEPQNDGNIKDIINFIYANIVLSQIKPESRLLEPYKKLLERLRQTLKRPTPHSESLALHFIAVTMLWPEKTPIHSDRKLSADLQSYVSQMKNNFSNEMKTVCNGKRAAVHFYLGKKIGYERLIPHKNIEVYMGSAQSAQWQNGKIWENKKVKDMLLRVTGRILTNGIEADTSYDEVKVQVSPFFKSDLCGERGAKISFFIGFSINGPVAHDIRLES